MEKVSVIIPVYNSEKYIERCLDSVLNQNYINYEILVINDGSKDNSQIIIDKYKQKYPEKIVTVFQENKGVAKTRNESIKKASGKYIMFIDNDDYIDKDYIDIFVKEIEKEDLDAVIGGYRRTNQNGKILKQMKLEDTDWSKLMIMAPWAKIYKKEYLINNKIEFLNCNLGEDVYFNLKAMLKSNNIKVISYIGYNWFFNTESVSNTTQKNITQLQVYELLNRCYDMVEEESLIEKKYNVLLTYFLRYIVWLLFFSTKRLDYKTISEEYNKLFDWLKIKFPNYKKDKIINYLAPKGETFSNRFVTETFLIMHKLHLGKLLIYLYSKI